MIYRKRLIARKQSTDPRIFCMVSKKMKRNEQHNPLSPRKERRRRRKRKRRERNKEVRGSGQPLFCCSHRLRTPTIVKSYN